MPQQWLANTTAPGVAADDRLDFVIYGAAARGEALCCDATLVSPVRRDGSPLRERPSGMGSHCCRHGDGSSPVTPSLLEGVRIACAFWPQRSGGAGTTTPSILCSAWSPCGHAKPLPRCEGRHCNVGHDAGGAFWQRAACSAVLGIWTMPPLPNADSEFPLAEVLHLAADSAPSRLPLR